MKLSTLTLKNYLSHNTFISEIKISNQKGVCNIALKKHLHQKTAKTDTRQTPSPMQRAAKATELQHNQWYINSSK
jgi:hypothetical protein